MYTEDVNKLSNAYFQKYNKNLIGKELGQFKDEYNDIYCDTFIATAKKFYYSNDKLKNKEKISSKGIPLQLLLKHSDKDGKIISVEQLFTDLYNGEKVTFSNANFDKVMFKHNKDLTISNNTSFNRTVQFKD
jgi:co-chaperonin GroES (HSP10)